MQPMLRTFRRHRLMPALVVMQIALATAILCNTLALLQQRLAPLLMPDGVAARQLILVSQIASQAAPWTGAQVRAGEDALRAIPGVAAVASGVNLPMLTSVRITGNVSNASGKRTVNSAAMIGNDLVPTLGAHIVAGRDFRASELVHATAQNAMGMQSSAPVILTRSLARHLFPHQNPLGQSVRIGQNHPYDHVVVGVVSHLVRSDISAKTQADAGNVMLLPARVSGMPFIQYAVLSRTGAQASVLKAIPAVIDRAFPSSMRMSGLKPKVQTFVHARDALFRSRRAAAWLLSSVTLVVLIVTLIGIMGLTGFWVQQRTRQIGVRRALGARRVDILRYFQTENFLLATLGIALGCAAAIGINVWLMAHYAVPRLPIVYLPIGAVALWLLGQLAVLGPALRAARVPPTTTMRAA